MATCKDCIHYDICLIRDELSDGESKVVSVLECEHFKDHARFVELPCKLGDTVYYFNSAGKIFSQKVSGFIVNFVGILVDSDVMFDSHLMGDRFFSTREEAEQALSKRTQKKENEFYRGHCVSDDGKFCKHIKAAKGDNLSNDNTMSCEYGEVNCPYAKPLEEVNAK